MSHSRSRLAASLAFLVLAAGAFYWFSLRPEILRKRCANELTDKIAGALRDNQYANVSYEGIEPTYVLCLGRAGLSR